MAAGDLSVDLRDERAFLRGASIKLGPKAFSLLCVMMKAPQQLITKDDLIDKVWGGRAVSDAVLTTAMRELRSALGDPARQPIYIETVHGRGYRFLKPVEGAAQPATLTTPADSTPRIVANTVPYLKSPLLIMGAVFIIIVIAIFWLGQEFGPETNTAASASEQGTAISPKSLVVVPFDDLSPDQDNQWFARGLATELIATLTRTSDIVVASTVASGFGDTSGDAAIPHARELGVAHALTGSLRRADGRVRVTVQLVRAENAVVVWSDSYERVDSDVIEIQEAIAYDIARSLRSVTDPEQLLKMVEVGTRSVPAYEALLNGHYLLNQQYVTGDASFRRQAYEAYEEARTIDPTFSEAHWQSARYWSERATFIIPTGEEADYAPEEVSELFRSRLDDALRTSPDETTSLKYTAAGQLHQFEFPEAHRLLKEYVTVRPNDPYGWVQLAETSSVTGDFKTGAQAANRLSELSDSNPLYLSRTIPTHLWVRNIEGSLAQAEKLLGRTPDNAFVQYHAHRTFLWAGEQARARDLLQSIIASNLPEHNRLLAALRQACADRDITAATPLHTEITSLATASQASIWLAHMLIGDQQAADASIRHLDKPESLAQLVAWTRYPHFDHQEFATLNERLTAKGVRRAPPIDLPYRCNR